MTSGRSDIIDISVEFTAQTSKAILVTDGTTEAWLPLSQVEFERDPGGKTYTVSLPEWLAKDMGLI